MSKANAPTGSWNEAGKYEIRLKGHLDARWAAWFDGLTLTHESDGMTVIRGPVIDQAALHGLLQKVRDIGLPLVWSLAQIPTAHQPPKEPDMTTTLQAPPAKRAPITTLRKTAFIAGLCYLITFVTSIPTLVLYGPIKKVNYILGSGTGYGTDATAHWGAFIEVILGLAGVGTALALYPVVKRQNQAVALAFVTSRLLEASMIFVGVVTLLSVITLRHDSTGATGADAAALLTTGKSLIAVHNWTFVLGQSLMPGVNAVLLGSLLYRSRLVPRVIPLLGLFGAPLLLASVTATIFGLWGQVSPVGTFAALPVALWELSLGVWLVAKGFTPSPVTSVAVTSAEDYR